MIGTLRTSPWRVLIASSHPLFAQGLRGLLQKRQDGEVEVVGLVSNSDQALEALKNLKPDLVIVDYDDERVNRDEFLARFVEGEGRLRVVLLSLKEGGSEAVVYDRRTMAASHMDEWLEKWAEPEIPIPSQPNNTRGRRIWRQYSQRRGEMKHFLGALLFVIVLTALGLLFFGSVDLLPMQASLQAEPIDDLFQLHFTAIAFLFALIVGFMVYSILFFRRRKGDLTDARHVEGNTVLELAWTGLPLIAVLVISFLGARTLAQTMEADPHALEVRVIGSQWSWRFEYPDLGITSTELVLPVNRQALLKLESTDVIHSFWVTEFRVKQDALPGGKEMIRNLRITPKVVGEFEVRCAELCGRDHEGMQAPVIVMAEDDFNAWVSSKTAALSDDPVVRGQKFVADYGCTACHSVDGTVLVGPSWQGVFGSQESLTDGTTVTVNNDYLVESIRNPGAKIVSGFENLMPANIAAEMTDQQIVDVIAYIESLQ